MLALLRAVLFVGSVLFEFVASFFKGIIFSLADAEPVDAVAAIPETPLDMYLRIRREAFVATFDADGAANDAKHNSNMEEVFYDRAAFARAVTEPDGPLEKRWRARILHETTPIGGIVMYYDVFKDGFAYHCDSVSSAQYALLNAVAMKYVRAFCCRDLFVDDAAPPRASPLSAAAADEVRAENDKKRAALNAMAKTTVTADNSPFVKFRTYNKNTGLVPLAAAAAATVTAPARDAATATLTVAQDVFVKNRFIYAGRIADVRLLQSPRTRRVPQRMSYAEFKRAALDTWADSAP
jgi:hypothetical protein